MQQHIIFVVVTHDWDFGAILAVTQPELEAGALLTIEPDRTRLRLLPLRTES